MKWFFRRIIGKKEIHIIDGRKITIIDKTNPQRESYRFREFQGDFSFDSKKGKFTSVSHEELVKFVKENILRSCKKSKFAKHFPSLWFILVEKKGPKAAFVLAYERRLAIYINVLSITNQFRKVISHELTHLWQKKISDYQKFEDKIELRLHSTIVKSFRQYIFPGNQRKAFYMFRMKIQNFFLNLPKEGLAEFFGYYETDDFEFSERYFNSLFASAEHTAKSIRNMINLMGDGIKTIKQAERFFKTKFHPFITSAAYKLGFHVIYSIIFLSDFEPEDLAKMTYHKLLRIYEKTMIANNHFPLITLSSGKGIIDYNKVLAEIVLMSKKMK